MQGISPETYVFGNGAPGELDIRATDARSPDIAEASVTNRSFSIRNCDAGELLIEARLGDVERDFVVTFAD